jgi:hypothetical protein
MLLTQCGGRTSGSDGNSMLSSSDTGSAMIIFREYEHDFGRVVEGEKIACVFTYANGGTADLIINSAFSSCGCTVPEFDDKPVPPEGKGKLEVVFDTSGREGFQTKTVTVKTNASTPVVILKITAEVMEEMRN